MAAAAQSLRLAFRARRAAPAFRQFRPQPLMVLRPLSTTAPRPRKKDEDEEDNELEEEERVFENYGEVYAEFLRSDTMTEAEKAEAKQAMEMWEQLPIEDKNQVTQNVKDIRQGIDPLRKTIRAIRGSFWNEEERDSEMITNEFGEDDFEEDDITSMGHAKLEEHREMREYARIAVWEMPLLSKLAKPFEPPSSEHVLRFRYTSYMGEFHPAEKKVVVQFCPNDLGLTEQQQSKLAKLAGPRYNPETGIIKMSCEMFEHQAQNKRYLGDLVEKMIAEAKDPKDTFEDVPLDTRHHEFKVKPKFPKEWRLTPERKQQLEAMRQQALLTDEVKRREGTLIDGATRIQQALSGPPKKALEDKVAELVAAGPRPSRSRSVGPRR
ncbi:mitochondrial ribosomal protein [Coniochaeta ligniaria NRRL 30616]|uniref:Small ribosomal subunit protein mS35 n=1 Tax=Coniochaeta ligniaria NRRL 30616 TaxID=1408157 RepID=A0A1J7INN7_9PEZI|nr:mitochondrial ribosomal protein [Coniochaeta ligniaria NRRL 30616]